MMSIVMASPLKEDSLAPWSSIKSKSNVPKTTFSFGHTPAMHLIIVIIRIYPTLKK